VWRRSAGTSARWILCAASAMRRTSSTPPGYWQVRGTSAEALLKSPKGGFRPDVEGLRACAVKSFI
jgi:hypothetical protein